MAIPNSVDRSKPSSTQDARTWERWIRGIGFEIYILAALGILFYAVTLRETGWNWPDLRPYVIGILALGAVLLILNYGWDELKKTQLGEKTKQVLATIILIFFVFIIAAATVWVGTFFLREAGILPSPVATGKQEYKTMVDNTHDLNITQLEEAIKLNPAKAGEFGEIKEQLNQIKNQIINGVDLDQLTSLSNLRPLYNKTIDKMKKIDL